MLIDGVSAVGWGEGRTPTRRRLVLGFAVAHPNLRGLALSAYGEIEELQFSERKEPEMGRC